MNFALRLRHAAAAAAGFCARRRLLILLAIAAIPALPAAQCSLASTAGDIQQAQSVIAQGLPVVCAALTTADAAFQTVAATGKVPRHDIDVEKAAMAGITAVCANPAAAANPASALTAAATAYAAVVQQLDAAHHAAGA